MYCIAQEWYVLNLIFVYILLPFSLTGPEDKKLLKIVLVKSDRSAGSCWRSLLEGMYNSDAFTFNEMEKKLTLERFQREVGAHRSGAFF